MIFAREGAKKFKSSKVECFTAAKSSKVQKFNMDSSKKFKSSKVEKVQVRRSKKFKSSKVQNWRVKKVQKFKSSKVHRRKKFKSSKVQYLISKSSKVGFAPPTSQDAIQPATDQEWQANKQTLHPKPETNSKLETLN